MKRRWKKTPAFDAQFPKVYIIAGQSINTPAPRSPHRK
jgi:hypothetical protein